MKGEILSIGQDGSLVLPSDYRLELGIDKKVLCILEGDQLIIRPFYETIREESKSLLDQLRDQGYQGEELLQEYKERKAREAGLEKK